MKKEPGVPGGVHDGSIEDLAESAVVARRMAVRGRKKAGIGNVLASAVRRYACAHDLEYEGEEDMCEAVIDHVRCAA